MYSHFYAEKLVIMTSSFVYSLILLSLIILYL